MTSLLNIVIIIDEQKEIIAIQECITLGIPTICLVDTDYDLDLTNIPISANDDARACIWWILNKLILAISEGH